MAKELLAYRLNSIHNLFFYVRFMKDIRNAIRQEKLDAFKQRFYELRNESGDER